MDISLPAIKNQPNHPLIAQQPHENNFAAGIQLGSHSAVFFNTLPLFLSSQAATVFSWSHPIRIWKHTSGTRRGAIGQIISLLPLTPDCDRNISINVMRVVAIIWINILIPWSCDRHAPFSSPSSLGLSYSSPFHFIFIVDYPNPFLIFELDWKCNLKPLFWFVVLRDAIPVKSHPFEGLKKLNPCTDVSIFQWEGGGEGSRENRRSSSKSISHLNLNTKERKGWI